MRATTKWFDAKKGYGFLTDLDSKKDVFVHQSNIVMDRFRYLNENDVVNYDVETQKDGREQAVNVYPVLTRRMIEYSLQDENLYVKTIKDSRNVTKYLVVDENNVNQTDEKGIDFLNLAAFTGFDIEGLTA